MAAAAVDELLLLDLTDLRRCLVPPLLAGLLDDDAADADAAEPECLSGFLPVLPPPDDESALPLLPPLLPTVAMRGDSGADDE